jgi:hypothetical protein
MAAQEAQRREQNRGMGTDNPGLDVVHPDAAGIDIGNSGHYGRKEDISIWR